MPSANDSYSSNSPVPAVAPATVKLLLSEFLGTAALLAVVIGSGIMAQQLSPQNLGVALLANTLATVFGLWVLISILGPISGAHFNPVVSLVMTLRGALPVTILAGYAIAQLSGAALGAAVAHAMFDLPIVQFSGRERTGTGQWLAEAVATAGLVFVILRSPKSQVAGLVAAYIGAAYWFTASTSFANPAAVFGRMLTDTFAGIAPANAPMFVVAQVCGGAIGLVLAGWLNPESEG
jgi:glycerol uptake facilitator-like aquaporin